MQLSGKTKGAVGFLAVLAVIAFGTWIYQLINGLAVTGMSNGTSWGLYITNFMFFVGLSAGGLIVASSAEVFHIESFKKVAVPAVITSIVCICVAAAFILIDLGGIQRFWRLFTGPNFMSPLIWDVCVISIYLVINILDLYWMCSKKADPHKVEVLSRFALPTAILVHSVTAWIFGLQIAKAWYSAIMAPIFVASALDSGLALLLIALVALKATRVFDTPKDLIASLAGLLAVFIAVDGFFVCCELLTMGYPGASESVALMEMATGATAPFFWFEIIFGLLVPFCMLVFAKNRQSTKIVITASVFVVLGVFCKRVWLLFTSFITPNVFGAPGITLGTTSASMNATPDMWTLYGTYAPTLPEIVIVIGVIALGILVFILLANKLLATPAAKVRQEEAAQAGAAA